MSVLGELSETLAGTVEGVSPSIVSVDARRRLPATGIVWSNDGVIVTAHHVVRRDDNINIGLPNGETAAAALVGRDPTTDLAVLRTSTSLDVPNWSNLDDVKVGHLVLALGRPGSSVQATLGVISSMRGAWRTPMGGKLTHYVQTDVVMYPGFSGGPLVDAGGNIIGLNTSGLARGVSLAVPNTTLQSVVNDMLSHGRVRRGYLGVAMQPVRLPTSIAEELEQETGLLIVSVEPDSPAEAGGLVLGDTIVGFDGESVRHMDHLLALLSGETIGRNVEVKIVRGGSLQNVTITVGENE